MSFATDLYGLMTADSSLNSTINGGINYENLPDNFDLSKKWILYYFRRTDQIDCMSIKNAYAQFEISVMIIVQNTTDLENLSDYTITYLNGKNAGGIIDINFTGN